MIRVDLGKDNFKEGKKTETQIGGLKLPANFPDLRTLRNNLNQTIALGTGVAVGCLIPLFFSQYRNYVIKQHEEKVKQLHVKVESVSGEIAKFTPFQKELQSYEQQKKVISDRLGVVRSLLEVRSTPVNVLDAVGQSLPARAWVTGIEFSLNPDAPSLSISGRSYSNEEISDFLDKLSESVYLSDVSLNEVASQPPEKGVETKKFNFTAHPRVASLPGKTKPPGAAPAPPIPPKPPEEGKVQK